MRSLRLRLLVASIVSIVAALVLAGFVLVALFGRHVDRRVEEELSTYVRQLAGQLSFSADGSLQVSGDLADPRFTEPLSGLYWQIQDDQSGARLRSRSLWDYVLPLPPDRLATGAVHQHTLPGPGGAELLVQERQVVYSTPVERTLRIAVAVETRNLQALRAEFAADLVLPLAALAAILVLAGWVQVWFGLRPLHAVRRALAAVRARSQSRLIGRFPAEITPLVTEVNELLEGQERAIQHARHRAADLAHGMKTPLTVLISDAQKLQRRGETEIAAELETLARSMQRHIDHELARARLSAKTDRGAAELRPVVEGVVATLRRTPQGEAVDWRIALPPDCIVGCDPGDLTEIVGNLLENAVKWARTAVSVEVGESADGVSLRVLDDGPGVPAGEIEGIGQRGVRVDEAKPGSGIGLSIVREIITAYGGRLFLENRQGGGLAATVLLPRRPPGAYSNPAV